MNVALWPLSMNVVKANAARPSGAGSAAGTDSTSVATRDSAAIAMSPPPPARETRVARADRYGYRYAMQLIPEHGART